MIVQYVSDLHLGQEWYFKGDLTVPSKYRDEETVLVLGGDQWEACKEFTNEFAWMSWVADTFDHVVMVAGNHDYYHGDIDKVDDTYRELAQLHSNVHFLQNDSVTINGVNFLGSTLWTDFKWSDNHFQSEVRLKDFFRLNDANCIFKDKKLIKPEEILRRHVESVDYLKHHISPGSVVVTHHNPTYKGMHAKWKPRYPSELTINHLFYSDLDWLIEKSQPAFWIAGHTHDSYDVSVGKTRVLCNPRGYVSAYGTENTDFDWNKTFLIK